MSEKPSKKRADNRIAGYIKEDLFIRFENFKEKMKDTASKSRTIEKAIEHYLDEIEMYGLAGDLKPRKHGPNLPLKKPKVVGS